ncbi:MAG: hypothetical protein ACFFCR_14285, partial [Promethearchaeota archaeon]
MKRIAALTVIILFFLAPSIEGPTPLIGASGLQYPLPENDSNYSAEGEGSFEGTAESLPVTLNGLYSAHGTTSFDSSMPGFT